MDFWVIFVVCALAGTFVLLVVKIRETWAHADRMAAWQEGHVPLDPNSTNIRLDGALRDAEQGFVVCDGCGFENLKRQIFCVVCGSPVDNAKVKAMMAASAVGATTSPRDADHQNSRRSRRAERRKTWTLALIEDDLRWVRKRQVDLRSDGSVACLPQFGESDTIELVVSEPTVPQTSEAAPNSVDGSVDDPTETLAKLDGLCRELRTGAVALQDVAFDRVLSGAGRGCCPNELFRLQAVADASRLPFPAKLVEFITWTTALQLEARKPSLKMKVHRNTVREDSIQQVALARREQIRAPLRMVFKGEHGIDAGGVYREWLVVMNEQLVRPETGIFTCLDPIDQTFYLNHHSRRDIGEHHLAHFFAVGRLIGRALLEGNVTGFHLSLPLLKIILGQPVSFADLEYLDPETYKNLQWLLDNEGVDALGLDFSVTETVSSDSTRLEDPSCDAQDTESDKNSSTTKVEVVDLIPNGRHIDVTDDNKHEYVDRRFRYMVFERVSSQLFAFLKGVYEVVPIEALAVFDYEELDYALSGSDEIDVNDWERNTKYTPDLVEHPVRVWFWELVREMPSEHRRRLLQFATGSSRVPLAGFAALTSYDGRLCPFTLRAVQPWDEPHIRSHACFNRLDLPKYRKREDLALMLQGVVGGHAFGFTTA